MSCLFQPCPLRYSGSLSEMILTDHRHSLGTDSDRLRSFPTELRTSSSPDCSQFDQLTIGRSDFNHDSRPGIGRAASYEVEVSTALE